MNLPPVLAPYSKLIAAVLAAVAASVASGGDWRVVLVAAIGAVVVFLAPKNADQ